MVSVNGKKVVKEKYKKEKEEEKEFFDDQYEKVVKEFKQSKSNTKLDSVFVERSEDEISLAEKEGDIVVPLSIKDEQLVHFAPSKSKNVKIKKLTDMDTMLKIIKLYVENAGTKNKHVVEKIDNTLKFSDMYKNKTKFDKSENYNYAIDRLIKDTYNYIINPYRYSVYTIDEAIVRCGFEEIQKERGDFDV